MKEPTLPEALEQAKQRRAAAVCRVETSDGMLYAETLRGRTDKWHIRRLG